ncbi:MAG: Ig-like domain-containing protein [Bacteroidales bacterium]|jgi:hypothetical protein|nr:Ig-like domain-containing protein [Bacteroidales bacterium]
MKKLKYYWSAIVVITAMVLAGTGSCTRDFEELEPASYPITPEVFIDGFSAGLNYAAFGGSKVTAFDVDKKEKYEGSASMRFEVPDYEDPAGAYAGGTYFTTVARDLSGYDALTFWVRASKSATIDLVGFGNDLGESKYLVSLQNIEVNTNWKKIIIPIPDPSRLTKEKGMFFYSEGPEDGKGYTFWIDEVKFEKLGTIAHRQPIIFDGNDKVESAVNGLKFPVGGLKVSFNMPTGIDQTVVAAPAYFAFASSNAGVASVDATGLVSVLSEGTAVITATSGGVEAEGSLTVQSAGDFVHAPVPSADQEDVISIFSNQYVNVPVDFYNGYWQPYQTTTSADFTVEGDAVLVYNNFNFVGIQFTSPTVNATTMTHLHMDIWIPNEVDPGDKLAVKVVDMGPDGSLDGNDPTLVYEIAGPLDSQSWISVDISLSGLSSRSKVAQIILERLGSSLTGFYMDNIYFYGNGGGTVTVPTEAAPTPQARDAASVISIYGDAYTNLAGTDYPDWGQATVVSEVPIAGNNTLKFAGLNYQGIQLASSQNVTGMEYLHLDFWSVSSTGLNVFLISPGPLEKAYVLSVPTTGWTSIDIPLTSFAPVNLGDIIQLKFDGNGDIYLDNIYFYTSGGGTGSVPAVAAPVPPARDAADVISLFSNAYTNRTVSTWSAEWDDSDVADFQVSGDAMKKYTFTNFAGIDFSSNKFDASAMTHFHMDIWTPDEVMSKSLSVKMVDFGGGTAEATSHILTVVHTVTGDIPALQTGSWVSVDVPITAFTGSLTRSDLAQMVLTCNLRTLYIDNVYFYKSGGGATTEPTAAAPVPTRPVADVISLFSGAYTNVAVDTWRTDWSNATYQEVTVDGNPTKKYSALDFVGIETGTSPIDATTMTHLHLDVWSPDFTSFGIKLVDFGANGIYGGGDDVEHQVTYVTPAKGVWVSYDIPLSDFTNLSTRAHLAQYILVGQPSGATSVWIDNFYFYSGGTGPATEPTAAAPVPTRPAASVISMFSGAYTNVTVDTWRTDWSAATYEEVTVAGNPTKKYSGLDFVGIETGTAPINATTMTHLHLDVWSPDFTSFGIKLVDFGANGVFGGGDDVEHQVNYTSPARGSWVSYDIPLSDFTNLTTRAHLAQYIFVGQPSGATSVWIDNIYFYSDGGGSTGPTAAAPTPPARSAANVVSIYSDAYTNITVNNFDAGWCGEDAVTQVSIAGNNTLKKNAGIGCHGIDFSTNRQNLSTFTHIHFDFYTDDTNLTGDVFNVKLVDFAGGAGEASALEVNINTGTTPAIVAGTWVSVDINITALGGVVTGNLTRSDVAQFGISTANLTNVWYDNIYLYK